MCDLNIATSFQCLTIRLAHAIVQTIYPRENTAILEKFWGAFAAVNHNAAVVVCKTSYLTFYLIFKEIGFI